MRKGLRIKKRIERDKKRKVLETDYDSVFTFSHFIEVLPKCLKGVRWKRSVQAYFFNSLIRLYESYKSIKERRLPTPKVGKEIIIYERGKKRIIIPIHIADRIIQKILCEYALVPILSQKLIYDNGASLKNKGVGFSRRRFKQHLKKAIKEYGTDFYILSFDFKDFFNSVPHSTCRKILERYIKDKEIVNITMNIIKQPYLVKIKKIKNMSERKKELIKLSNDEYRGMCLGSQVSQIMALIIANDLDHFIKDKKHVKHYIRYMDDGLIMAKTKEELQDLFKDMRRIVDDLGLVFNLKKTHIIKSNKGITFLKYRYYIMKTGKIITKLSRKSIIRMRRKLKKYRKRIDKGLMTISNAYDSIQSWLAYTKRANAYVTTKNMKILYNKLFPECKLEEARYVLQINKEQQYCWRNIA